jgi:beta-fructofuranosidase
MPNRRELLFASLATGGLRLLGMDRDQQTELQRKLATDPNRPQYHLLPPAGPVGDPNGPIFWKGKLHMFYQHPVDGEQAWGHAMSEDLVHWKHLPVALVATPGGPDKDGCFSGSAVIHNGVPTLVYTGVWPEVVCIATGDDTMTSWKKYPHNPVIASPPFPHACPSPKCSQHPEGTPVKEPPPGTPHITEFRDSTPWKDKDAWYMTIGSGFKGVGGAVLLFRSEDLVSWEYLHPLYVGKMGIKSGPGTPYPGTPAMYVASGEGFDCPDFFPLGDKYVLVVSTMGESPYFVGRYVDHKLIPEKEGVLDLASSEAIKRFTLGRVGFGTAKTVLDERGRRIMWGNIPERWKDWGKSYKAAGWSGVLSLPRVLSLRSDSNMAMEPAPELKSLRGKHRHYQDLAATQTSGLLEGIHGDCLEIAIELDPGDSEEFGLRLRCARDFSEQTVLGYRRKEQRLFVDTTKSTSDPQIIRGISGGYFRLDPGGALNLHVFLDASVMEVFANNGQACLTERIYSGKDSLGIGAYALGGKAQVLSMDIWEIRPISPNRLTT